MLKYSGSGTHGKPVFAHEDRMWELTGTGRFFIQSTIEEEDEEIYEDTPTYQPVPEEEYDPMYDETLDFE